MIFLAFVWTACTAVCLIIEGTYFGSSEVAIFNYLTVFKTVKLANVMSVPVLNLEFFTHGIPMLLTWDYSFLSGAYSSFKMIGYILDVGVVWGLYEALSTIASYVFS